MGNCLVAGFRAFYLVGDLIKLSSLEINSGLLAPLLLAELPTLAKLATLVGELLFIGRLAELALALLTLKVGLIPIEGLAELIALVAAKLITLVAVELITLVAVELIALVAAEPIFIDGPAPLALLNCLAKSPSIEFSSLKLS